MNTSSGELLLKRLRALRRRLVSQLFVERLARAGLFAAGVATALSAWEWARGTSIDWRLIAVVLAGAAAAWALGQTVIRRPTSRDAAQLLDRLGRTRDRWITALVFRTSRDPIEQAAAEECAAYVTSNDFRQFLPWRVPRAATWLIAPLLTIALLQWTIRDVRTANAEQQAAAAREVAPTVAQLDQLANALKERAQADASDELTKVAEQLKRSAERLRADAKDRDAAEKAALRELSSLEQLVQEMQRQAGQLSPEEIAALAKALEQQEETESAAEAMQAGNAEEAAKALEEAARQLAENGDSEALERMQKTLQQALERLAQQKQLSEAMEQVRQQLAQQAGQGGMSQLLQKLAQMLRKMPQSGTAQQPGKGGQQQSDQQTLQTLLSALQNMKQGQPPGQIQPGGQQSGSGQVLVESFGGDDKGQFLTNTQIPTGQAGSEYDRGTTETPFGSERSEMADKGGEIALRGQLGEGESLSQMLPAAGGDDKSRRRYKELYEAMAPAASDALLQENIPLGSRFFIKRYFESIRPPE